MKRKKRENQRDLDRETRTDGGWKKKETDKGTKQEHMQHKTKSMWIVRDEEEAEDERRKVKRKTTTSNTNNQKRKPEQANNKEEEDEEENTYEKEESRTRKTPGEEQERGKLNV